MDLTFVKTLFTDSESPSAIDRECLASRERSNTLRPDGLRLFLQSCPIFLYNFTVLFARSHCSPARIGHFQYRKTQSIFRGSPYIAASASTTCHTSSNAYRCATLGERFLVVSEWFAQRHLDETVLLPFADPIGVKGSLPGLVDSMVRVCPKIVPLCLQQVCR